MQEMKYEHRSNTREFGEGKSWMTIIIKVAVPAEVLTPPRPFVVERVT